MENLEMDNSTLETGAPDTNGAETLESIMGTMTPSEMEPKTEPKSEGNDEGNGKAEDKAQELPSWTQQLSEDARNNADFMKQMAKFKKIGDLAQSYSELEKKLGSRIAKPGDDASDEEIAEFYKKIGRPESADGYSVAKEEGSEKFIEQALKCNLTDRQATAMFNILKETGLAEIKKHQEAKAAQARETEELLKKEYGNSYGDKLKLLAKGVETYGGKGLGSKLKETGLLFDPDVVKMFVTLGEMASEANTTQKEIGASKQYRSNAEGGGFTFAGLN